MIKTDENDESNEKLCYENTAAENVTYMQVQNNFDIVLFTKSLVKIYELYTAVNLRGIIKSITSMKNKA